jgi:hypothetical protein
MEKVYLYHIKKTGGRSLKLSFFNYYFEPYGIDPVEIYALQSSGIPGKHIGIDDMVIGVSDEQFLFESNHRFMDDVCIPNYYFKITILRDPIKRLLSYYRMIDRWNRVSPDAEWLQKEKSYIENGWEGFLNSIPKEILLEQIRMFSKNFDIKESFNNIISLNHVMINENYKEDLTLLSKKVKSFFGFDLNLKMFKYYGSGERLSDDEIFGENKTSGIELAKRKLSDEYKLYDSIVFWKKNILNEMI